MSKYRVCQIVFLIVLSYTFYIGNLYLSLGTLILFMGIAAYGSFNININFHQKSINSAPNKNRSIILSFDDGPSPEITPKVLEILKKYSCKAVFFCIGNKITGNETLLLRMKNEGHLIANHTYTHSYWFDLFPIKRMAEELKLTNEEIFRVTANKNILFRPPYGVTNPMLAKAIKKEKLISVGWNKRSLDTVIKDKNKVLKRLKKKLKPGDIILLHDHLQSTPEILEEFLMYVYSINLKVERIDKVVELKVE